MRRIRSRDAAAMLGLSTHGTQALAARGELPGAAKIGQIWTFDPDKLRRFIEAKEAECASANVPRARVPIGCEPPPTDSPIKKAYERAMAKLLGRAGVRLKKKARSK
ncbi:MAG: helix-turn-helix domain-containing protein [Methylocystis sp.]